MSASGERSGFVGRVLGDRWVVGEQLGSGSFGVVHAGVERATGAPIAVKLLHPQFLHHGETIARFWNEAEALRRMNHPNVLTLLAFGVTDDGVPYLVTELLTGETLRDLLNREGALPPERAMRLLGPAAHALHHAHQVGVVHRDLKPENIFRVRKEGMGTTKILDFGVAKLLDTAPGKKLSQTGIMIGTMAYSPPEQMQGLPDIDHRADQFGFAALMFEALTGNRPFPQQQPFALFQAIMSGPRPRATDVRPELPAAADAVLARALDPDREKRYGSVEEFYLSLTQALTGQRPVATPSPVVAPPRAPAPAPEAVQRPAAALPVAEVSVRFRPILEEATRGDQASDGLTTATTGSPVRPRSQPPQTLHQGNAPPPPSPNLTLPSGSDALASPASREAPPVAADGFVTSVSGFQKPGSGPAAAPSSLQVETPRSGAMPEPGQSPPPPHSAPLAPHAPLATPAAAAHVDPSPEAPAPPPAYAIQPPPRSRPVGLIVALLLLFLATAFVVAWRLMGR